MSDASLNPRGGDPLILLSAGAIAVMLHLVVFAQGLSAFQAAVDTPPPPRAKETRIIATALSVAGDPSVVPETAPPVEDPQALTPERVTPETTEPEALAAVTSTAERITARADPVAPVSSATAPTVERLSSTEQGTTEVAQARETITAPSQTLETVSPITTPEPVSEIARAPVTATETAPVTVAPIESSDPIATPGIAAVEPEPESNPVQSLSAASPERERIPETLDQPPEPEPEEPIIVEAEPQESLPQIAETLAPVDPDPERLALLDTQPEEISPIAPPLEGVERTGIASSNDPAPQTAEEAQETYTDVLDVLRAYPVVDCFAALPSLSEDNAFQLETFANSPDDLEAFRTALADETQALPGTVMKPISEAQCDALPFVTKSPRYPEFQLYFDLTARDIPSGTLLEGRIGNLSGGFMSLMLVDDDGIVQDLTSFLRFRPGAAEFSIPMTLQGSPVETRQLLMALSTTTRLQTLRGLSGQPAADVFTQLTLEILRQGGGEDIALVAFSVR